MTLMGVLLNFAMAVESEPPTVEETAPVETEAPVEPEEPLEVMEMEVQNADGDVVRVAVPYVNITPSYGVGTSYNSLFSGVVSDLPYGVHYVYYRDGRYDWCLAYSSDLVLSGSTFSAPSVTMVTYNTNSDYQDQPTYSVSTESNFSLSAGNYLVYSDLGSYPDLYSRRGDYYAELISFVLCGYGLFYLMLRLRNAVGRRF